MRNSLPSKSFSARILKPLLILSMLSTTSLCACSTLQAVTGQATVAPKLPPERPILPRPPALSLKEFHAEVQPAVGGKPPLVTFSFEDYSSVVDDLADSAIRLCQDSWLLDYYEGKNDGVKPADWCSLPALPALPVPPKK